MANVYAIHSVGYSLATFLRNTYPEPLRTDYPCDFQVLSSSELADVKEKDTTLSIFLHRVTVNEHLRNVPNANLFSRQDVPLSLNLHFLLTVWADSALIEQTIFAWAMRQLYQHPTLNASSLSPEAEWDAQDVVQILPAELSNEDLLRIWDVLEPQFHLSFPYVARVVRIDPDTTPDSLPVVDAAFTMTDYESASQTNGAFSQINGAGG